MWDEQQLKEYFEYYLTREIAMLTVGINTCTQPSFINWCFSYFWNRLRKAPLNEGAHPDFAADPPEDGHNTEPTGVNEQTVIMERVAIVWRMSQLATLLERHKEVLRMLETAHIWLASEVLTAVAAHMKDQSEVVLTER